MVDRHCIVKAPTPCRLARWGMPNLSASSLAQPQPYCLTSSTRRFFGFTRGAIASAVARPAVPMGPDRTMASQGAASRSRHAPAILAVRCGTPSVRATSTHASLVVPRHHEQYLGDDAAIEERDHDGADQHHAEEHPARVQQCQHGECAIDQPHLRRERREAVLESGSERTGRR